MTPHEDDPRDLRRHAEPVLDDARLERQWSAIEAGLPEPGGRRRSLPWSALVGSAALAAAVALWLLQPQATPHLSEGARVASEEQPIAMRLDDGSNLELSPRSELRLRRSDPDAVELELAHGRVRFDVAKRPGRLFQVHAGGVRVRVVGTRFDVRSERSGAGTEVEVTVQRGVVEVLRAPGAEPIRIGAGESWSTQLAPEPKPEPVAEPATPTAEEAALEDVPGDTGTEAEASPEPEGRRPSGRERAPSAQDLFNQASLARRAGRMQEAADTYAELLSRHAGDARAGLAAFELGRIRMDALHQPARAIEAFQQALRLSPNGAFHEDAMARIVIAHDVSGHAGPCREARDRYLSRYPGGVHAAALATRCGE